jgi:hypothetical protein
MEGEVECCIFRKVVIDRLIPKMYSTSEIEESNDQWNDVDCVS